MDALKHARAMMQARSREIGEPAIQINPDHLLINSRDPTQITMRMDHLIELVDRILEGTHDQAKFEMSRPTVHLAGIDEYLPDNGQ